MTFSRTKALQGLATASDYIVRNIAWREGGGPMEFGPPASLDREFGARRGVLSKAYGRAGLL
jgi:hypothetical protein